MVEKLTALQVQSLARKGTPGAFAVGGATGLYLRVSTTGTASWTLRTVIAGKRVERGLGGYPAVTLAQAREKAAELRNDARQGVDPKARRDEAQQARKRAIEAQAHERTFEQAAEACIRANESRWRNLKHAKQWRATLTQYAYPVIGTRLCSAISHADVVAVLEPLWQTKQETSKRVRGRIAAVLDYAVAHGWRPDTLQNPAHLTPKLKAALPALPKRPGIGGRRGHHAAMLWQDVPAFMLALAEHKGVAAQALAFAILTAARSGEVRGMRWCEVEQHVWTVPAERMKAGRTHRVPLSRQARAVLDVVRPVDLDPEALVFPSPRTRGVLSDMAFTKLTPGVTAHGFRSSFRDWCADTGQDRALAEAALAHAVGDAVEAAYQRSDMLDRRRVLMQEWSEFITPWMGLA